VTTNLRLPGRALALAAVNLGAVTFFLLSFSRRGIGLFPYRIDLDVYRIGGQTWLHGGDLYGRLPPTRQGIGLPFSYPPISAVLLAPLSLPPMAVAGVLLTLATIALTAVVLRVFLAAARPADRPSWRAVGWLLPPALLLEPVRNTIGYGQVNVLLMALVAADCLVREPRWPRGALVGLAAAVKLTPGAFVLFFLLRRDYRAARTAALWFAASTGAGFLLDWPDSVRYWTSVIFQTGRPGSPAYAANQSIGAVLARAGLDPHAAAGLGVWLGLSVVTLLLAWRGMRYALEHGRDAWAVSLNAFAALLISPISWSHHWVWGVTAMLVLACQGLSAPSAAMRRCLLALAAAGTAVFAVSPQWLLPHGTDHELHWAAWEQLAGSSYVLLAVAVLAVSAAGRRRTAGNVAVSPATGGVRASSSVLPATHTRYIVVLAVALAGASGMGVMSTLGSGGVPWLRNTRCGSVTPSERPPRTSCASTSPAGGLTRKN
jgi:alpha-1,2-mannosyltransferase